MAPFDVRLVDQAIDWAAWIAAGGAIVGAGAAVVAAVVIVKTARYARESLDDAKKTRHAQLVTDLSRRWDDPEIIESSSLGAQHASAGILEVINRLYSPPPKRAGWRYRRSRQKDLDLYFRLFLWPNLLESIGCLLAEGAISETVVSRLWGAEIVGGWETFEAPVNRLRELQRDLGIYDYFENLAERMVPLYEARRGAWPRPDLQ
jgi:hypothetical protein